MNSAVFGFTTRFFCFLCATEFYDWKEIFQFFVKRFFSFSILSANSILLLLQHLPVTNFSSPTHNLPLNLHDSLISHLFHHLLRLIFFLIFASLYRFKKSPNFLLAFSHKKKHTDFIVAKYFSAPRERGNFLIFLHDPLCFVSREDLIMNGTTQLKR